MAAKGVQAAERTSASHGRCDIEAMQWPAPTQLEGVKSRKRAIFEVEQADLQRSDGREVKATGLRISLSSRIAAIGETGRTAALILAGEGEVEVVGSWRQNYSARVVHLGPSMLANESVGTDYMDAVNALLQTRPHVVILDEALEHGDSAWAQVFAELLNSTGLRDFRGAVVVCLADETHSLGNICSECWVGTGKGQKYLRQEPYLHTIENALVDTENESLMQQASSIEYCNLDYWMQDARKKGHNITFFAISSPDGSKSLRGFVCYHMKPGELHIRFIFVPKCHRASGYGGRLVRWIMAKAARMPESLCRWISLSAADDDLVSWYEQFGFVDMTCGHVEGDDDQTWMELQNTSIVPE